MELLPTVILGLAHLNELATPPTTAELIAGEIRILAAPTITDQDRILQISMTRFSALNVLVSH